jgi:hypothetical protein
MNCLVRKVRKEDIKTISRIEEFLWNESLKLRIDKLNWKN